MYLHTCINTIKKMTTNTQEFYFGNIQSFSKESITADIMEISAIGL